MSSYIPTADLQAAYLEDWVASLVDDCMPLRTIRIRPGGPRWLDGSLVRLVAAKNRLYRRLRLQPPGNHWVEYRQFRNYVKSQVSAAKRMFYAENLSKSPTSFLFIDR